MTNKTIQKAIDIAGSQKKLADLCGIDARYVMKIVSATNGKIKAAEIRPDLAQLLSANSPAA